MPDDNPTIEVPRPYWPDELEDYLVAHGAGPYERAVLTRIARRVGEDGACYESARGMAEALQMSAKRVRAAQARLVEIGVFVAEKRLKSPTIFRWGDPPTVLAARCALATLDAGPRPVGPRVVN